MAPTPRYDRFYQCAARHCGAVAVLWAVAGVPDLALADKPAVTVRYFTKVPAGGIPRVEFVPTQPIAKLSVQLRRDDGERVEMGFGATAAGEVRALALDSAPGRRRYEGDITVLLGAAEQTSALSFETQVTAALEIQIDRARLDLSAGQLVLMASRPLASVEITTHAGGERQTVRHALSSAVAGAPITLTFPAAKAEGIARIDVKATDLDGFFTGVSLLPWSVSIPHEEVAFATDAAEIAAAERPKLEASLKLIGEALAKARSLGPVALYIAGHTDTVGGDAYNLKLSTARAQAIGRYMRGRGLRIPIFFEGFGERSLAVATPDERAEPRNRRVDYILALEPPTLGGADGFVPQWKRLP